MRPPVKLSAIDQEHLQELYDAAGVPRDTLPYTEAFEQLVRDFQDRTFKNADKEQVYAALLKYTRSGSAGSAVAPESTLTPDQKKQLKSVLPRHAKGSKILPYSEELEAARQEFNRLAGTTLTDAEFWQDILALQGSRRRPPTRAAKPAAVESADTDDDE